LLGPDRKSLTIEFLKVSLPEPHAGRNSELHSFMGRGYQNR
jgi:hypothetical protein